MPMDIDLDIDTLTIGGRGLGRHDGKAVFVAGTAPTDWTYVNRTFQLPAGFPNIELGHSYSIAAPGSGSPSAVRS